MMRMLWKFHMENISAFEHLNTKIYLESSGNIVYWEKSENPEPCCNFLTSTWNLTNCGLSNQRNFPELDSKRFVIGRKVNWLFDRSRLVIKWVLFPSWLVLEFVVVVELALRLLSCEINGHFYHEINTFFHKFLLRRFWLPLPPLSGLKQPQSFLVETIVAIATDSCVWFNMVFAQELDSNGQEINLSYAVTMRSLSGPSNSPIISGSIFSFSWSFKIHEIFFIFMNILPK